MSIKIMLSKDKVALDNQIKALKYLLQHDTNQKDKKIHAEVLQELIKAKQALK